MQHCVKRVHGKMSSKLFGTKRKNNSVCCCYATSRKGVVLLWFGTAGCGLHVPWFLEKGHVLYSPKGRHVLQVLQRVSYSPKCFSPNQVMGGMLHPQCLCAASCVTHVGWCSHVVDIAGTSVDQARERYADMVKRGEQERRPQDVFSVQFITADCSKVLTALPSIIHCLLYYSPQMGYGVGTHWAWRGQQFIRRRESLVVQRSHWGVVCWWSWS